MLAWDSLKEIEELAAKDAAEDLDREKEGILEMNPASTVRKTSCERSIGERRGRRLSEGALTLAVCRRYLNRNSPQLLAISSHLPVTRSRGMANTKP
jgi:hypothetical protein